MKVIKDKWLLRFSILAIVALPLLLVSTFALAAEISVPSQFAAIQSAIDASQDGDAIIVQPGIYRENIDFRGKAILLTSTDPLNRSVVSVTIIDGDLKGSVVTFNSGESRDSILSGFTIRGGSGTPIGGMRYGGGIYIGEGCSPTILHNVISGNTADIGGAIYIHGISTITANPASLNLVVGDTGNITFSIFDPAPAGGLSLILSSSVPIVATVPPSATIPEGQKSVEVDVTAVGYGTTTITANATGYTKVQVTVSVTNPPLIAFSPSPLNVAAGLVEKCTVNSSNPAPTGGLVVNLSGGAGKIELPASVTIAEARTSVTFNVKGVAEGSAAVTATASGYPDATLQVNVTPATFNLFPGYLPVALGRSSTLLLSVPDFAPTGGLTVNIASSNTGFVTVQSTVTIPEGEKSVFVPVNGVGVGSAAITASLTGFQSATATVNVLEAYNISFVPGSLAITPGTTQTTDVVISSPAPEGGLTITLTNPSPDKVSVPASTFIPEGKFLTTITVGGLDTTSEPVQITGSCPGLTEGRLSVTVHPKYQPWIKANVTVGVGTRTTGGVGLTGATAPTGGYTVNLTSSDPGIASVPATVTIPQGNSNAGFTIVGRGVGTAQIMVSVGGFSATSTVTVVKPTFNLSVSSQMTVGAGTNGSVTTYVPNGTYWYYYNNSIYDNSSNQGVDQALTVSLSSENPAVIQVPASATIAAGSNNTSSFNIQAVGTGTSTLTASALGWDSKTSGTITVP